MANDTDDQSTLKDNRALQFAASHFLNGEYAVRHAYFSKEFISIKDKLNILKNKIEKTFSKASSKLLLQAITDYGLFLNASMDSVINTSASPRIFTPYLDPCFSTFFFNRHSNKCSILNIDAKILEQTFRDLIRNYNYEIEYILKYSLHFRIYITDLLFPIQKNLLSIEVQPEILIKNSFSQFPDIPTFKLDNNQLLFVDYSDSDDIFNNPKIQPHTFKLNFHDPSFNIDDSLELIKKIYYIYKFDDILDNFNYDIYIDNVSIKHILVEYIKRAEPEEISTKILALTVWDGVYFNGERREDLLSRWSKSNIANSCLYDNVSRQYYNTKHSIDIGKIYINRKKKSKNKVKK